MQNEISQNCGSWKSTQRNYYSYNTTVSNNSNFCPNLPVQNDNWSITSQYLWLINSRYAHRLEFPSLKLPCNTHEHTYRHLNILSTVLNPEPQNILLLIDRRIVDDKLSHAIRKIGLHLLHSLSPQGMFVLLLTLSSIMINYN